MKVQYRRLSFMSLFMATVLSAGLTQVHAQDMLSDTEDLLQDGSALQMDDLQIDGKLSPSEQLRKRREKLEERNKNMVEKKIEDIRVKQEIALTNKLSDAFGKSLNNLDDSKKEDAVKVQQSAPVAPQPAPVIQPIIVETKVEAKEVERVERNSKVIPSLGAQAIKGNNIDFESKMNIGVLLETKVQSNLTMGLGLGYTTLSATDATNNYSNSGYYNGTYNNYFNNGRTMSYSKLNVEASGKYFFTLDSKVKPFVGAGIDFNRSKISYDDGGNGYNYNGVTFGGEAYTSNYFAAKVKVGAEIDFNETVGFNIDLSYAKSISSGIAANAAVTNTNPDQQRLQNITDAMEKSDVSAVAAGVVIKF